MVWYDTIRYIIWYDIRYDMVWYDMIWYDMIWYDTIRYGMVTAVGFPSGGSGRWTCTKLGKRQIYTTGKNTQNNKKRRIHKIENKSTK